mmetsp:Transcript_6672/g.11816  ORF Transcript_6672/g.11816 Transcript_6672/m.11816 type:complete len:548 (+) Transcript_6672:1351-2994(+)
MEPQSLDDVVDNSLPTAEDRQMTAELEQVLRQYANYENEDEARRREVLLGKISDIFKDWCYQCILKKPGMDEEMARAAGGKIFTFGSYRLGVHGSGTDIDILCVAPKYISREEFERDLYETLRKQPSVSKITGVFKTKVPLIKMVFDDVPIDLLFASLNGFDRIGDELRSLQDDEILQGCDEKTTLSLNGCRNTDQTLALVPDIARFRTTLRLIRLWAKKRGIYSNVLGFPGGAAWSILVAKVCKMYPNQEPSQLVQKFFKVYALWDWNEPVCLKYDEHLYSNMKSPNMGIMNVMTPAYPSFNSTHSVGKYSKKAICEEIEIAHRITTAIMEKRANWRDLFEELDFFQQFNHFLKIEILAKSSDDLEEWHGFVLSKIKVLIYDQLDKLKPTPYRRINPMEFEFSHPTYPHSVAYFVGLKFFKQQTAEQSRSVDMRIIVLNFIELIEESRQNQYNPRSMNMRIMYMTSDNLPADIQPLLRKPELPVRKRFRDETEEEAMRKRAKLDEEQNAAASSPAPVQLSRPEVQMKAYTPKPVEFKQLEIETPKD